MSRVNYRGWTPNESDPRWDEDGYYEKVCDTCDMLARKWSILHHEEEQEGFRRVSNFENGYQDYEYGDEEDEDFSAQQAFETQKQLERELHDAQMEIISNKLYELGARMMRPYEHWNEDEAYMAYSERDR